LHNAMVYRNSRGFEELLAEHEIRHIPTPVASRWLWFYGVARRSIAACACEPAAGEPTEDMVAGLG